MRFRLVLYRTKEDNKLYADNRHEYFGDKAAIWYLWYAFTKELGYKHVEVFSLDGIKQEPEKGIAGMIEYSI